MLPSNALKECSEEQGGAGGGGGGALASGAAAAGSGAAAAEAAGDGGAIKRGTARPQAYKKRRPQQLQPGVIFGHHVWSHLNRGTTK